MFRDTGVFTTRRDTTPLNIQRNWRFYHTARHNTSNVRETGVFTTRRDTTPLKCSEKLAFLPQCRHDTTPQSKCSEKLAFLPLGAIQPLNVQRNWRFYHMARYTSKCSEKLAFQPHSMFRETGVSTTLRDTTPPNVHKNRLFPSFSTPHSLIPPHGRCHPVGGKSVTVNYIVTMTEQSLPAVPQDPWNTNLCRAARA